MCLDIMFYYLVYQQIQILIEIKPCYSIINVNLIPVLNKPETMSYS